MRSVQIQRFTRPRRAVALSAILLAACALLLVSPIGSAQEGRPRRSAQQPQEPRKPATTAATPRQTPTPKPTPRMSDRTGGGVVYPGQVVMPDAPPDMVNPEGVAINEGDVIKGYVDLVNLNVRVIDRNNRPVGDVRQEEFEVFENGVPQPIFSFSKEEVPVSYGLAIDTSGSLRQQLPQVIEAGKTIINSNKP